MSGRWREPPRSLALPRSSPASLAFRARVSLSVLSVFFVLLGLLWRVAGPNEGGARRWRSWRGYACRSLALVLGRFAGHCRFFGRREAAVCPQVVDVANRVGVVGVEFFGAEE